jgi:hypothetical protein
VALWSGARGASIPTRRLHVAPYASYDVDLSAPEPRFLFLESAAPEDEAAARPVVVLNWVETLRARAEPRP